ncbi:DUF1254 domain-containing protein [Solimonas marina]|uniref:DUF1254 domain-containing protein n=1 Tax=Solimonas marina TaxID=2714601 RepID=A0A969WDR5_9GAMM|nr:DUF1254 domain-containing protein [Solimonas marina]NKF23521.1 DUF1254 domain-containing protein [Solimonas marina]
MTQPKSSKTRPLKFAFAVAAAIVVAIGATLAIKASFIKTAAEAYLFGYPLVITDVTRVASDAFVEPENVLFRKRRFPDPKFHGVARPNVDTLYTNAFIDMNDGPFVFSMAQNTERYNLMPLLDGWTNVFASLGTRTYGTAAATYLIAGPKWHGQVPDGMKLVQSPTRIVWLIGRTQTNGKDDYPLVHKIQDGIHLVKLSDWLAHPDDPTAAEPRSDDTDPETRPGAKLPTPPIEQVRQMSAEVFFTRLAALMVDNPPAAIDAPMMARLAGIGIAPGQAPQWGLIDRLCANLGRKLADHKVAVAQRQPRATVDGWWTPPASLGVYGTDYPMRAVVAMVGLGANQPADAMYPNTDEDLDGQKLDGSHSYHMHFAAGALPPVDAFWSITAYGPDDFLIPNDEHRYAIRDRDALSFNADGSLDLYFGPTLPTGAPESNWLPVKRGEHFLLNARLYWPKASALNGSWHLPPVRRMD